MSNQQHDNNDRVDPAFACPGCGQRATDSLVWIEDDRVACQTCGTVYNPLGGGTCAGAER